MFQILIFLLNTIIKDYRSSYNLVSVLYISYLHIVLVLEIYFVFPSRWVIVRKTSIHDQLSTVSIGEYFLVIPNQKLLDNLKEMFPRYYMHSDGLSILNYSTIE